MKKQLLISFKIHKGTFSCYGNVSVSEQKQVDDIDCPVFELFDVSATRVNDNGEAVDYSPTESTWAGTKYTPADMVTSIIHTLLIKDVFCDISFIHPELQKIVDFYGNERIELGTISLPRHILCNGDEVYKVMMVTKQWAYYSCDDMLKMYRHVAEPDCEYSSLFLVADGYFAELGFFDSTKSIKNSDEQLLYLEDGVNLDDYV